MADERSEFLQGTLDMLVLRTLALEPMHGWGLAQRIGAMSNEVFTIQQGTLYPALQRLKRKGWVSSEWRLTAHNRRARYYSMTRAGEKQLERDREQWARASAAINAILDWTGGRA